jgi:hypothetical protein
MPTMMAAKDPPTIASGPISPVEFRKMLRLTTSDTTPANVGTRRKALGRGGVTCLCTPSGDRASRRIPASAASAPTTCTTIISASASARGGAIVSGHHVPPSSGICATSGRVRANTRIPAGAPIPV